jgi:hypothetical protein
LSSSGGVSAGLFRFPGRAFFFGLIPGLLVSPPDGCPVDVVVEAAAVALFGMDNMCIVTLGSQISLSTAASQGLFPFASGFTDSTSLARIVHKALSAAINCANVTLLKFAGGSEA